MTYEKCVHADWHVMVYGPALTMDMLIASNAPLLKGIDEYSTKGLLFRCDSWMENPTEPGLCLHVQGTETHLPVPWPKEGIFWPALKRTCPALGDFVSTALDADGTGVEVAFLTDLGEEVEYFGEVHMAMRTTTTIAIASVESAAPPVSQKEVPLNRLF